MKGRTRRHEWAVPGGTSRRGRWAFSRAWLRRTLCGGYRTVCASFVLILPFGYYTDSTDTADMALGIHGGTGRVASVLRSCEGEALHSEASTFKDASGSAEIAVPPGMHSPLRVGVRAGYWESMAGFAIREWDSNREYSRSPETKVNFSYVNPNVSIETPYWGLGAGYVFGDVSSSFDDYGPESNSHNIRLSMHLRLGNIDQGYLAVSYAENTPLISGGGPFDLGFGYRVHRSVYLFTGMSAGFYDGVGFLQQARVGLMRRLSLDVAMRLGGAGGAFEPAISAGLVYSFRLSAPSKRSP